MAEVKSIHWTKPMFDRFRKKYDETLKANQIEFEFDGHQFLTSYAFYLIEYLEQSALPQS